MSMGNFPKSLSQRIFAGRFLVGRLGVSCREVGRPRYGEEGRRPGMAGHRRPEGFSTGEHIVRDMTSFKQQATMINKQPNTRKTISATLKNMSSHRPGQ